MLNANIVEGDAASNAKSDSERRELIKQFRKEIKQSFEARPNYARSIKRNIGSVVWKKMQYFQWEGSMLAFLPVANKNSTKTKAIIVVFKQDGQEIRFFIQKRKNLNDLSREKQDQYQGMVVDQEIMIMQFMLADKTCFDLSDCELIKLYDQIVDSKNGGSKTTICHCKFL